MPPCRRSSRGAPLARQSRVSPGDVKKCLQKRGGCTRMSDSLRRIGTSVTASGNVSSFSVGSIGGAAKVSVVAVAQLVRVPDCDSGGRGFESPQPPH